MTIQVKDKNGITYIEIKDEMTIYTALEQNNKLSHYLKANQELRIDLSEVSEIDSAGLQILLFLKQEATTKNIILNFFHHSQAVVEIFEMLNLTAHFGDPVIISADWKSS